MYSTERTYKKTYNKVMVTIISFKVYILLVGFIEFKVVKCFNINYIVLNTDVRLFNIIIIFNIMICQHLTNHIIY